MSSCKMIVLAILIAIGSGMGAESRAAKNPDNRLIRDGQEGHGGDIAVSIFIGVAYDLVNRITLLNPQLLPSPEFHQELAEAISKTDINSADRVTLGGVEVDAVNFPDRYHPRIVIGRERWLDPRLTADMRALLVLHEYLSILGFDDRRYGISIPLIQEIKKTGELR